MKKALLLTIAAIISVGTAFAANPILRQKYTADPNAFVWGDRLYIYASYDNNNPSSSGYDIKFYTLMSTDDMANWTDHGEVYSVGRDGPSGYNQAYAPGAAVKDNKVYLYIPNGGSGIGVATAVHPAGPFTGSKTLITGNTNNNTNVPWLFDPAGFVDSDGQGYIYFGGGPADGNPGPGSNLRAAKLGSDMMSATWPATTITGATRSFEAAYMHKNGNTYYFSFSQNFTNGSADIAYMTGTNPLGPFTFKGTMLPNSASGGGNNHAGVVQYKNNWYIAYHDRKLRKTNNVSSGEYRSVSVDKLEYNSDGTIKQVVATDAGPDQIKNFNPYDTVLATTMFKQSGTIKTAICSAPNPGTITNSNNNSPGTAGDKCVMLVSITDGSWVNLKSVNFTNGATSFVVRAASASAGGSIEIRTGSQTGTLAGTCAIPATGGASTWQDITCSINMTAGVKDYLYLVFKGSSNFRISKYIFKSGTSTSSSSSIAASSSSRAASSSSSYNVTCNVNNLDPSYVSGSNVPRPNVSCGTGVTVGTAFIFNLSGSSNELDGWNSNSTHAFWTPGKKDITLSEVTCGSTKMTLNPALSCGSFEVVAESGSSSSVAESSSSSEGATPVVNHSPLATNHPQAYYSLKGEPLGNAKPQKAGIYVVKQGNSIRKIAVR
ncbi:MAG: family 43 glycosylhydrolase [Fibromonadaceae bacterium]|jgi:arabinoxylan arabinofuranohydrolase|nr:family 43 glycosylhydrolase [Fibromonadaceae bacterium]